ncbi:MAG: NADP-dependent malic enzyme [bacterium]|nr:NADP-dependent malic enzyme [bacterium]
MDEALRKAALDYHEFPEPGKISVTPTKAMVNQRDLALAYSPGVAAPCEEIERDPSLAAKYTARGNLVAVITNGTAVLGLGDIGPLASKPVMEGKGVLFKKFAGVDVFDIEINEKDPEKLVEIIASLEPTFGGINLEDIKAPECFYVEKKLRERMKIPVFHDDQHGTSIIVGAGLLNALKVVGKDIKDIRIVCSGAGAAALACLDVLTSLGARKENIFVADSKGVCYEGRTGMDESKARFAQKTEARSLADVMPGADMFLGLSSAGVLKPEMLKDMTANPIIFALANPTPEIMPELAKEARPDAIIATGRSDYPNQVNNALCFPYIFRGALDVGATTVNEAMKIACVHAIANLAHAEQSEFSTGSAASFGREYLIPTPLDPRLIMEIAPAVAKAAMETGVATRPIQDFAAYRQKLSEFVYNSAFIMKPVFAKAKAEPKTIVYCEGEDERVLRAVQVVVDEGLARPMLIGRPAVIEKRLEKLGLRIRAGKDFVLINQDEDPRFKQYWTYYHDLMARQGISPELAQKEVRRRATLIGSLLVHFGEADGMICGTFANYSLHLRYINRIIPKKPGVNNFAAMNLLMLENRTLFICDTYVNPDPTAEQIAEMTLQAAEAVKNFGLTPKVALLSHSSFGSEDTASAAKMRKAWRLLRDIAPELEVEGEMHGDAALDETIRSQVFPNSLLKGAANLLIMPTLDAANIAFNLLKVTSGSGVTVGPILLGTSKPVHILTPSATVRRIINMTAVTVAEAGAKTAK